MIIQGVNLGTFEDEGKFPQQYFGDLKKLVLYLHFQTQKGVMEQLRRDG